MNNTSIQPLTKILDSNDGGGQAVDIAAQFGPGRFLSNVKNDAGSSPTLAVKLQHGDETRSDYEYLTEGSEDVALRIAANNNIKLAASITTAAGDTPSVRRAGLLLKRAAGLISGTLTLTLETDSSGPSGTVLATATYDLAGIGTDYEWVEFVFETPATLAAETKYWIVLASDYTADATDNVTWRANSGLSSGGNQATNDGTTWTADADDSQEFYLTTIAFSDVVGGGFTTVNTTAANQQAIDLPVDTLKQFVRAHYTVTGTSTPAFYASLDLLTLG